MDDYEDGEAAAHNKMQAYQERLQLYVGYNNLLTDYSHQHIEFVSLHALLGERDQFVGCARHVNESLAREFGHAWGALVVYKHFLAGMWMHARIQCLAQEHEHIFEATNAVNMDEFAATGMLRLCEIVDLRDRPALQAPHGFVAVVHRRFVSTAHYAHLQHHLQRTREYYRRVCAPHLRCVRCCERCEPVLLFKRYPRGALLECMAAPPEDTSEQLVEELHHDDGGSGGGADSQRQFIGSPDWQRTRRYERHNALLWFMGGVRDPLETFWRCCQDIIDEHHASDSVEAIARFQDEALARYREFVDIPEPGRQHWTHIHDTSIAPRLQTGQMYFKRLHAPHALLRSAPGQGER